MMSPTSPPKISFVVSDLSESVSLRAYLLSQVCQSLGYDVEVVGFQSGPDLYAGRPKNIPIFSIPWKTYPQFLGQMRQLLTCISGDIIYAVKPKPSSFGVALLKQFRTRCPLLLDIDDWEMSWYGGDSWAYRPASLKQFYHDTWKPRGQLRQPDHPLYVKWMESLVSRAHGITVNTSFLQHRFGGVYVPNGKDTELFNPGLYDSDRSRERYGLSNYRVLMFPGAPRPHKGVEDVLIALDQLNQPDLRLVIVGGSPYDNYDDCLQQKWGRWIIKLPRCPMEQMPDIIAAAHVIVVPQRDTLAAQSQFPLKMTDGMAMAKPVLSTTVGDIPTILGDTGYVVAPESPNQLAEAIATIFSDFETARLKGQAARTRCMNHYSVKTMAEGLATVMAPYASWQSATDLSSVRLA